MKTIVKIVFLSLFVGLIACNKNDTNAPKLHHDYFGLTQGRFIEYNATEIAHLSNGQHDTIAYQLRTVIGDTVYDNEGRLGYKYFRYKRDNTNEAWDLKDVWFTILTNNRGELVEENERIVKMVFAPTFDKTWNGNAFNTLPEMEYSYSEIHAPMTINGFVLDSTVTVMQEDVFNLIQYRKKYEVYAKNIGMVKKYFRHLEISNFNVNAISTGKELFLTMTAYGKF
jgi:hypothetical protein